MYIHDSRTVVTLDAGGTNLVFGAMKGCEYITEPITYPSNAHDLDLCLDTMVSGFREVIDSLDEKPVAISFAFPGPADYPNGIIGGFLPNFPSFREGVALGPFLENEFGIPVFINNDGDLFAYGEALCGALPDINCRLAEAGSGKRYRNLLGYTFGTGFGVGMVVNGQLNRGDNSCVETFCLPHKTKNGIIVEEGVAVRAVKRVYAELSGDLGHSLEPKDICEIADGKRPGDVAAARRAFEEFGETAGDAMAIAAQLIDGIIVIGGGITAARHLILPSLLGELRASLSTIGGDSVRRVQMEVFNLDDQAEFEVFARGNSRRIPVRGTDRTAVYDDMKRIGVTFSRLGASKAISAGAYAFALSKIDGE
ncbi:MULTISPECIES: ROK family protein [Duncaniella]|uniref:ROK family protein n=1 Tax=Duncaniella TaxID=2518495 RepID=UPI0010A4040C|nr:MULTISPECIES: ROK family protein [Duncaniella]QCD38906.1 ROK family protein [Duncaniella sp. C9]QCP72596.1 ROK family protein [Duncaniella sp. B8]